LNETVEFKWISTVNDSSWEISLSKVMFNSKTILNGNRNAIVNPSVPFIVMPADDFAKLRNLLSE
jgi:hypothetical protein